MSRAILAAILLLPLAGAAPAGSSGAPARDDPPAPAPAPALPKNDWSRSKAFAERTPVRARRLAGAKTEAAVLAALDWLVRHQLPDGGWSSDRVLACCADPKAPCRNAEAGQVSEGDGKAGFDAGVTALALLALAGRGNTHLEAEKPKYREAIDRGIASLLAKTDTEGDLAGAIGRSPECEEWIYNHAIATLALAEILLGSGDRARLGPAVAAAAKILLAAQAEGEPATPGGRKILLGWKYDPRQRRKSDTSVTGWATQAIWTVGECRRAGLVEVDAGAIADSLAGAAHHVEVVCSEKGVIGYESPGDGGSTLIDAERRGFLFDKAAHPAMVASGLFSYRLSGAKEGERIEAAWTIITDLRPRYASARANSKVPAPVNYYAWYFISHAWAQMGGTPARHWKTALETELTRAQRDGGCEAGSWDTVDEWSAVGGRAYATAMAALSLQAPYRLDPPKR